MYGMFANTALNQDLSHWCVSSVVNRGNFGNSGGINPSWGESCPCTTSNLENTDCIALDNDNINTAVSDWIDDSATAIATYGHIKDW